MTESHPHWRPETLQLHAGYEKAESAQRSRAVPIYQVRVALEPRVHVGAANAYPLSSSRHRSCSTTRSTAPTSLG